MRVVLSNVRFVLIALVACSAPSTTTPAGETVRWPTIVDSHVHVDLYPVASELAKTGVGAVVDLAARESSLPLEAPLHVIYAGPMLTSPGGYPLDSWGAGGYGIGCGDRACVEATIDRLAKKGARVVKLALDDNGLDPALVPHAVAAAHARAMKVAVHALSDRSAALAASAGADLLAHAPVEKLRRETVDAWKGRAVITTLAAFGGSDIAISNLQALRGSGVTILYGTDLGNTQTVGPNADEVALLARAGLDNAAIVEAMTTGPARYWNLDLEGTYLELDRDPRSDPRALFTPRAVWLRGRRM
jgi:hypothetical protein